MSVMRVFFVVMGILVSLLVSFPFGWSQSTESESDRAVPVILIDSFPSESLLDVHVREKAIQDSWQREKEQFLGVRKLSANVSESEKQALIFQLNQRRVNMVNAYLNGLIVSFQKVDLSLTQLRSAMLRLRVIYESKKNAGKSFPEFESRYQELSSRMTEIRSKNDKLRLKLQAINLQEVDRKEVVQYLYEEMRLHALETQSLLDAYRSFARQVVAF